ncbi:MAG: DUF554 domain-containing protein [Anaerolineales bacterium]|jgi:uncharacterized membrane protein YqgA involved in biofilm formation
MTGTIINIGTVLIGGLIGLMVGARFSDRARDTVISVLGLFTLAVGILTFLEGVNVEGEQILIPLVSLLIGGMLGEWWRIEARLQDLGATLEKRFAGGDGEVTQENQFIRGFLTASLLFCVGPMTILGSIQDGLTGDYELLAIKSVLDGFAAMALASTFGVGVLFSVLVVLVVQGGLTLLASQLQIFFTEVMIAELSVVGGILLLAIAIGSLLELRPIRTGNLLPALLVAPVLVIALAFLGLG